MNDLKTIGARLREIRAVRGKSLQVIADRAGMSRSHLCDIENGVASLYSLTHLVRLAAALEVAPSELTKLPVPAAANGHTDSTTEEIRVVLDAIDIGHPGGMIVPLEALRSKVMLLQQQRRACEFAAVATQLPQLMRDVHTTLAAAGTEYREVLALAVYLHVHVTRLWLVHACAPTDLIRRAAFTARRLAESGDDPTMVAVAAFGVADVLLTSGSFAVGQAELTGLTGPAVTTETSGFTGIVALLRAVAAQFDRRAAERDAALDIAEDMAHQFGRVDSLGFLVSPVDVGVFRMFLALEEGDPGRAWELSQSINPDQHPSRTIRTTYWCNRGRALAQLPGRAAEAVEALRTAESLFPTMVRREPMIRDTLSSLVVKARRDAVGRDLRGMAYRAGLTI